MCPMNTPGRTVFFEDLIVRWFGALLGSQFAPCKALAAQALPPPPKCSLDTGGGGLGLSLMNNRPSEAVVLSLFVPDLPIRTAGSQILLWLVMPHVTRHWVEAQL